MVFCNLKRSPGINCKSRVSYPGPGFLSSAWPSMPKKITIQWKPSCEATPFVSEKLPLKRGGLSSGVKINTLMLDILSSGLYRGSGLSKGVPL